MTLTNEAPEKIEIPPYDKEENIYRNFISISHEDAIREIKENIKKFNGKISFNIEEE